MENTDRGSTDSRTSTEEDRPWLLWWWNLVPVLGIPITVFMEKISLPGKVAVVTGGARGIGKAFVEGLLEKGAKVVILDILKDEGEASLKDLQGKFGRDNVYFYYCDVTNGKLFEDLLKSINKDIGKLDIMVNNAGVWNEDDWEQTIHINLIGGMRGSKQATELMRRDKGGNGGVLCVLNRR
ncbi:hypothetical protein ScPMuIL_017773 [Solemya velum]